MGTDQEAFEQGFDPEMMRLRSESAHLRAEKLAALARQYADDGDYRQAVLASTAGWGAMAQDLADLINEVVLEITRLHGGRIEMPTTQALLSALRDTEEDPR